MDCAFGSADFSLLPPHIITHILEYLKLEDFKNANIVCKSWHYASCDPQMFRTLMLQPKEDDFPEICQLDRRYGGLILEYLKCDKSDDYYFELFEKFCPFIKVLRILQSRLTFRHLRKLLELSTSLEVVLFHKCTQMFRVTSEPRLFPLNYDQEVKNQIVKNLSGIKKIEFMQFNYLSVVADILDCAKNLETFEFSNTHFGKSYEDFFKIFNNYDATNLKHIHWNISFSNGIEDFIGRFINIKNLNLESFSLIIFWDWNGDYKSSIFRQFLLKLEGLLELTITCLKEDQLSLICQHLPSLKSLDCRLSYNNQAISSLTNLKQLEIITHILSYLKLGDFKNAISVCRSWYDGSTDPQIDRFLILQPTEEDFPNIYKSNRRYGVLKLHSLQFDQMDSHYFDLFGKFCPFIHELHIIDSNLEIHHLLKLFELSTSLEVFSLIRSARLVELPRLFPLDWECDAKNTIIENLSGIKTIVLKLYQSHTPLIGDLVHYMTNLQTFQFYYAVSIYTDYRDTTDQDIFAILDNYDVGNLRHLNWIFNCYVNAGSFITRFLEIKNLNLKSFKLKMFWNSDGGYNSTSFRKFILNLNRLEVLEIDYLRHDQLLIICRNLVGLKQLCCSLQDGHRGISELTNLKQLEILNCRFSSNCKVPVNFVESDKLFNYKFEFLRTFIYHELVTESNLIQFCENHPTLIELRLYKLSTRNLEPVFKHLLKLRDLTIYFRFTSRMAELSNDEEMRLLEAEQQYEYKISRLQDLEVLELEKLVSGICEADVRELKNLWSSSLDKLLKLFE